MIFKKVSGQENTTALYFLAPSLAGFLVFFLIPFILSVYYSFLDSPINGGFVWLSNYKALLTNRIYLRAGSNTLVFTLTCVPLNMILSLVLAMLLNKKMYCRNVFRTFFISPLVIPVASVVLIWQVLFDDRGALNALLAGLGGNPVDWMNTGWARMVVLVVYLWKNAGYNMVLFLAGLQNIPAEYYESSYIDGASPLKRFTAITLVYLTPTSFFIFVISIINSFKVFRETYMIAGEYPHDSIYMLQHYMNNMFISLDYQKLTSAACIMAVAIYLLVLVLFVLERKISNFLN